MNPCTARREQLERGQEPGDNPPGPSFGLVGAWNQAKARCPKSATVTGAPRDARACDCVRVSRCTPSAGTRGNRAKRKRRRADDADRRRTWAPRNVSGRFSLIAPAPQKQATACSVVRVQPFEARKWLVCLYNILHECRTAKREIQYSFLDCRPLVVCALDMGNRLDVLPPRGRRWVVGIAHPALCLLQGPCFHLGRTKMEEGLGRFRPGVGVPCAISCWANASVTGARAY